MGGAASAAGSGGLGHRLAPHTLRIDREAPGRLFALSNSPPRRKVAQASGIAQAFSLGHMQRREFITLLGGAASLPLAARAQQPMPVIGFLGGGIFEHKRRLWRKSLCRGVPFGLREMGSIEGQNVAIEYRFAENRPERMPELVADLVRRRVAVICTGNNVTSLAVKKATSEIRSCSWSVLIRFFGPCLKYQRPGGNATGVSFLTSSLEPKRLELMRVLLLKSSQLPRWSIQIIRMPRAT